MSCAKKKRKRIPPAVPDKDPPELSDLEDIQDELDTVIAVVETVVAAITEHNDQPAALVLQEHGLDPLRKIKEKLEDLK